jgi:dephospho-CoA kinase
MIEFKEFLAEGVYDRNIFKAFFLAGGPGSGKSWVSSRTLSGAGMKVINSDAAFEALLKKEKMSLNFKDYTDAELVRRDEIRAKAKRMTALSLGAAIEGRLGLILDSTARDVARIESERAHMEAIGYDTFMIFVNTSREVALVRNQERKRKLPDAIVIQNHKQVQANIGKLQNMFGNNNFAIIDNNKVKEDVNPKVYKAVRKLVNRDPTSKVAKDWVKRELARKSGKAGFWSRFKSKYL